MLGTAATAQIPHPSGRPMPKVFKVNRVVLPAHGRAEFSTSVSLAVHTTRTPHPGRHAVDVIINGKPTPVGAFQVVGAKAARSGSGRHPGRVP